MEHAPNDPEALNDLAWFMTETAPGDLDAARRLAQRAVRLEGRGDARGEYLDTLGWIDVKLGNAAEARRHLEEAARLSPIDLEKRLHREAAISGASSAPRKQAIAAGS